VPSAFFEPAGTDGFVATPATAGPWSAQSQHGGPPSAFPGGHMAGYLETIDWRYVAGRGFDEPGPAAVWARPKIPLIPGEKPSPMCRALLLADSGSGVSAALDPVRL
jgi:hypothetical protein